MNRTYHYQGFDIEVAVETDYSWKTGLSATARRGYAAIVRIRRAASAVAVFSPLRFGEYPGKPYFSEVDALMGGYSAGRRIVDDLFTAKTCAAEEPLAFHPFGHDAE
ncbi:hypothetical protein [Paraburkholderia sp. GAS334]|uniref:hypothetical protein n=1 Tax=Paraburkholderia sp. GAS334 TaxID=3035131 RepID=UPI003D1EB739